MGSDLETRIRHVTAVLGPTNTGKTHLAIERMLGHESGMIGLPLRLLAREVYDKIAARVGADRVALITGEEKIKPERARFWVCTVEAMPRDIDVDFLAIDEIQLAADPERGHVFTDRLLHARGRSETLVLGAQTMREAISDLIPGANFISRPRLSKLTYAGEKKITRLPTRSAVVAFSASEVYAIAELIRRQRGGAAVVLGALSPRTRNAQVALYQSGDVDFLVATDAIGMGLNLDVDHVAFAALRKFDGQVHRNLTPGELAQIAGRAGRHMNDGTFGVTGGTEPLDEDTVERLETHTFEPVRVLQWRNRVLDFASLDRLRDSLREMPREQRLTRARMADDVEALETIAHDREVADFAQSPAAVARLWEVCQVPDYRKISGASHAELTATLYKFLMGAEGRIPQDWFAKQVAFADRTDGDIDTLANRIAHIRTWTFVSNRSDWLDDPEHWQGRTREIEDKLSDALHERLTQRFVDKRTSALMKGMRDKDELSAEIGEDGAITVENHYVGRLHGFRFSPDTSSAADSIHGKAARHAAAQVLSRELGMRARRVAAAKPDAFRFTRTGRVLWREEEIARLEAGADPLKPSIVLLSDEHLSGPDREKVQARLEAWLAETIAEKLKPLIELAAAEDISGLARGIAFRLTESFGVLKREQIAEELKSLDQTARAQLRKYGVRFGAFNIYFPLLLKPAAADLLLVMWSLKHAAANGLAPDALPEPPRAGLTSAAADAAIPDAFYRTYGFHVCGPRAVRLDILERLADLIRPLLAWRANPDNPGAVPPKGATGEGGFTVTPEMMSILGCSTEELGAVLKALGFRLERRPLKTPPAPRQNETAAAPPGAAATGADAGAIAADAGGAAEVGSVQIGEAEAAVPQAAEPPQEVAEDSRAEAADDSGLAAAGAEGADQAAEADSPGQPPGATAETAASADAEEEKFEEVWRPRRHRQGERRPPPRDQRREPRAHRAAHGQSTGSSAPAPPLASQAAPAAAGAPDAPNAAPQGGRDHVRSRDRDRDRKPSRGPHQPSQQGRKSEDRGRGPDRRAPEVVSASPPRGKGPSEADSPFAKLGALREALERRAKEKSSP